MAFLLVIIPNNARAENEGYDIVAKSNKENITLYAKKMNDLYYDFKLDFKGEVYSRPFWINVANNITYAPQIFYKDINRDRKKELIIILNQGYGTGVLQQEIYVYGYTNGLIDILVDNLIAIINKNVKTKLTTEIAEIKVGDKVYKTATISAQIFPAGFVGQLVIVYEYRDKCIKQNQLNFNLHPIYKLFLFN